MSDDRPPCPCGCGSPVSRMHRASCACSCCTKTRAGAVRITAVDRAPGAHTRVKLEQHHADTIAHALTRAPTKMIYP